MAKLVKTPWQLYFYFSISELNCVADFLCYFQSYVLCEVLFNLLTEGQCFNV